MIRAPRRFSHPAWIPRRNVTVVMEAALEAFLEESGEVSGGEGRKGDKRRGKDARRRVEGVWVVGCGSGVGRTSTGGEAVTGAAGDEENDEMIWWSWEGKLVGFSDW
ncbi:hypothetical protein AX15_005073 [Amanita polypyramis BW_CC]|nr:hypothetical protein AX15_005073 [Amanita polypyramis BW_CC]